MRREETWRPESCAWQGDKSLTLECGKERKKWELERLGIKNLSFSRTWFLSACRELGSQNDSEKSGYHFQKR